MNAKKGWIRWGVMAAFLCFIVGISVSNLSDMISPNTEYEENVLIPEDITQLNVEFGATGKTETYTISGSDLETLKEWSKTLEYSMCEAPEELVYGNQAYVFKDKQKNVLFTYNSYKADNWYLIIGENWYSVSNPSRPLPDVI